MFVYGFGEYTPEYVVPKMLPIVYFIQGLLAFIIYWTQRLKIVICYKFGLALLAILDCSIISQIIIFALLKTIVEIESSSMDYLYMSTGFIISCAVLVLIIFNFKISNKIEEFSKVFIEDKILILNS